MDKEVDLFCPNSRADWRNWLKKNHRSKQSVWLIFFKTSAKAASLSWSEAVDEALCFGWIDSTRRTLDKERYMQYFTRRKPNSIWSKVNKEKVARLIRKKLMRKAGFDSIEAARQNGSWSALDEVEALEVPEDLKAELARHEASWAFFDSLSKSTKKMLLHWVISAKRPETRQKRISEIVQNANQGQKPGPFR